jgi:hypothetical protein
MSGAWTTVSWRPRSKSKRLFALLARAGLVVVCFLRCDILGTLSVATASGAVTTEAPHWRHRQQGGIPDGAKSPHRHTDTDAPFAAEVQSFTRKIALDRPSYWPDSLRPTVRLWRSSLFDTL